MMECRPNSNDFAANHVLHHTTGDAADYGQQLRAFREVTCCQVCVFTGFPKPSSTRVNGRGMFMSLCTNNVMILICYADTAGCDPAHRGGSSPDRSGDKLCSVVQEASLHRGRSLCSRSESDSASEFQHFDRISISLQISCNIANLTHPSFGHSPIPFQLQTVHTNPTSLEAAVAASTEVLNSTSKIVLLVGPRIRDPAIKAAVLKLADASEVR